MKPISSLKSGVAVAACFLILPHASNAQALFGACAEDAAVPAYYDPIGVLNPIAKPGWAITEPSDEFNVFAASTPPADVGAYLSLEWNVSEGPSGSNGFHHLTYLRNVPQYDIAGDNFSGQQPAGSEPGALIINLQDEDVIANTLWIYKWQDVPGPFTWPTRTYHFTSGRIESKELLQGPDGTNNYGSYIEARIKLPKGDAIWPAFWLFTGDPSYHEVDILEAIGTNYDVLAMGTNYHQDGDALTAGDCKDIPVLGPDLSEDYYTYALQWESDRFTYLLNNRVVRVVTKADLLKEHPTWNGPGNFPDMATIFNIDLAGFGTNINAGCPLPAQMKIDYVRSYIKTQPAFSSFKINGQGISGLPIPVKPGLPVILDASESYHDNRPGSSFEVQISNSKGIVVCSHILTNTDSPIDDETDFKHYLDITSWCSLTPGATYKITLVARSSGGYVHTSSRTILVASTCVVASHMRVNGVSSPTHINIPNGGDIVVDISNSISCSGTHFFSMQEVTPVGGGAYVNVGTEYTFWFWGKFANWDPHYIDLQQEIIDVAGWPLTITKEYGKFYRVRYTPGGYPAGTWPASDQYIRIMPCNPVNTFTINDNASSIVNVSAGEPIILDGTGSFSCDHTYQLTITPAIGPPAAMLITPSMDVRNLNIRHLYEQTTTSSLKSIGSVETDVVITLLASGSISGVTRTVRLGVCPATLPVYFDVNSMSQEVPNVNYISEYSDKPEINLDISACTSCNGRWLLYVRELNNKLEPIGPEYMWNISTNDKSRNDYRWLNISKGALGLDFFGQSFTAIPGKFYSIKLAPNSTSSHTKYIYIVPRHDFSVFGDLDGADDSFETGAGDGSDAGYMFYIPLGKCYEIDAQTCGFMDSDSKITLYFIDLWWRRWVYDPSPKGSADAGCYSPVPGGSSGPARLLSTPLGEGYYWLAVDHGVSDPSSPVTRDFRLKVDFSPATCFAKTDYIPEDESKSFAIFPNPAEDVITVRTEHDELRNVEVFDLKGVLVKTATAESQEFTLGISELPQGVYLIKLTGPSGVKTEKFVISR